MTLVAETGAQPIAHRSIQQTKTPRASLVLRVSQATVRTDQRVPFHQAGPWLVPTAGWREAVTLLNQIIATAPGHLVVCAHGATAAADWLSRLLQAGDQAGVGLVTDLAALVARSRLGRRAVCPSCNARRMAETAAHLVDHVIPPLPVHQWVLSVPKRLRWYLEREPRALSAVLQILLRVIEGHLRRNSDAISPARCGAVSFIHRFGASLNRHVHDHGCVIDGVFERVEEADDVPQSARFRPAAELTPAPRAAIAEQVRVWVLRWCARRGLIEADDMHEMLA